jgi:hypothetical protein
MERAAPPLLRAFWDNYVIKTKAWTCFKTRLSVATFAIISVVLLLPSSSPIRPNRVLHHRNN